METAAAEAEQVEAASATAAKLQAISAMLEARYLSGAADELSAEEMAEVAGALQQLAAAEAKAEARVHAARVRSGSTGFGGSAEASAPTGQWAERQKAVMRP